MKKLFLLLFLFLIIQSNAFAKHCYTCNNIPQTPDTPLTFIGKFTGYDYLAGKFVEIYLQNYIKKNYNSTVHLNIKSKSVKALKNGEFKYVKAKSKKLNCETFTISDFEAKTICPYNKIAQQGDTIVFPYDIPVEFSAAITNDDLKNFSQNQKISFSKNIQNINWQIENSRLKVIIELPLFVSNAKITFSTGLKVNKGMVYLVSPSGIHSSFNIDVNKFLPYLNVHSPFSYILKLAKNAYGCIDLDEIEIKDDKIYVKGMFLIPQNCDIKK